MVTTLGGLAAQAKGVGCQAVLQDGHDQMAADQTAPDQMIPDRDEYCAADEMWPDAAVVVATFPMPAGLVFDWHTHPDHQLAWAASGVLTVRTKESAWMLPPSRALWIPAGLRHETLSAGTATMRSAYIRPSRCRISWADPTPVSASPLLAELIGYLEDPRLDAASRANAEAVLVDLLQPVAMTTIQVRMPADDRAMKVADAIAASPADGRTLAEWGREVGASERTLARAFLADTGVSFGRWRTLVRIQAALAALAHGEPVGNVARHVGYDSDSAFVQAFRRETGVTPAAYFRQSA
jgi:AraC-like DNA-binding protein/quercetin dioxygenase-like cupin family protein